MEVRIYRRALDRKPCVDALMYDPQLDMAELDKLRYDTGQLPEYIQPRWINVGVYPHYLGARKASKQWKKS